MNRLLRSIPGQLQSFVAWALGALLLSACAVILLAQKMPEPEVQNKYEVVAVTAGYSDNLHFVAYPNPAHGLINIEWSGPTVGKVIPLEAVGQAGTESFTIFLPAEEHLQQVNVTQWPAGTYQLRFGSGEGRPTREIVIQ